MSARSRLALPGAVVAVAIVVWSLPLQFGIYADAVITDIPTYQRAYDFMASGQIPYADFTLEYPPLAALLFWLGGILPGPYGVTFSIMMLLCLCATAVGVVQIARALGMDRRRQTVAGMIVAVSPLLVGNLVESRFDLALAALLTWTIWAAVTERWRLAWALLGAATLLKLVPLALIPIMIIWQRHRTTTRRAVAGAIGSLAIVAAGLLPFVIMSPSGTWEIARYHLDRPLQLEALGSAYLLGLHALAGIPVSVESSYGSQGLSGSGPSVIAGIQTAVLIVVLIAIAWTLWLLLHRARWPGDARLFTAAWASTTVALLVGGKVLSPQFVVWLLPACLLVAGRYGPLAMGLTAGALLMTFAYFPHQYWDLVALDTWPIVLLVVRDAILVALLAACWPRPSIASRPQGRVLGQTRADPKTAETAVSARFLVD